jgi:hypothetical protein
MTKSVDLSRRQFIKTAASVMGSGILLYACPVAFSLDKTLVDKKLKLFSQISSILTAREDLSDSLTQLYYDYFLHSSDKKSFLLLLKKMDSMNSNVLKKRLLLNCNKIAQ